MPQPGKRYPRKDESGYQFSMTMHDQSFGGKATNKSIQKYLLKQYQQQQQRRNVIKPTDFVVELLISLIFPEFEKTKLVFSMTVPCPSMATMN